MYVFGGYTDNRQISVVDGCKLRRLEINLQIPMADPLCSTYASGSTVMFCVTVEDNPIECWTFDGSTVAPVTNPDFQHDMGQG